MLEHLVVDPVFLENADYLFFGRHPFLHGQVVIPQAVSVRA
jgi:hypothetical protein